MQAAAARVDRAEKNAAVILAQKNALTEVRPVAALHQQAVVSTCSTAPRRCWRCACSATRRRAEIAAIGQLVMLTQRIGKSANEFLTSEGVAPEAAFLLDRDLKTFGDVSKALLDGNAAMNLGGARDPQVRDRLATLIKMFQETRTRGSDILKNLPGLNAARDAQATIIKDSEPLRTELEKVQEQLGNEAGLSGLTLLLLLLSAVLVVARRRRLPAPLRRRAGPARRRGAEAAAPRPSARRRKPSASTTRTRRRSCG